MLIDNFWTRIRSELRTTIFASSNFICLISNYTMQSETIRKEIESAFSWCYMISIWHNDYESTKTRIILMLLSDLSHPNTI